MLRREVGEWRVHRDAAAAGEADQVLLRFAVDLTLPAADRSLADRFRAIGNGQPVVHLDHAAEAAALRTGPERRIEGEKRGSRCAEPLARDRGAQPATKPPELAKTLGREHAEFPVTKVERGLRRLDKTRALALGDAEAILHDLDLAGARQRLGLLEKVLDAGNGGLAVRATGDDHALVRLAQQGRKHLPPRQLLWTADAERDEDGLGPMSGRNALPDRGGMIVVDRQTGGRIVQVGHLGEPDFEEVC